jgi:3-hydroxyacyl-CoA dehydrogenase
MDIRKVGVVGCGLMGSGIAQVAAMAGCDVVVREVAKELLDKGFARIHGSLGRLVEKGKLPADAAEAAKARLKATTSLADLKDCDLVIEVIVENLDDKKKLFAELGKLCKKETIFASNTSSFPIGEMAEASGRPERFVGLHFFNPVQLMKLVEVIQGRRSSPEVVAAARAFGEKVGKAPILAKDTPGFVVNRLLVPLLHEAVLMVERGDATPRDVDAGMELGCGHPMGPLKLLDYVGLDTTLFILEGWHQRYPNEPSFKPSELLKKMVKEGRLGRKSGRGFYEWEGDKVKA